MKVHIFWATNPVSLEPEIIDSSEWKNLPKRKEPRNPVGTDIPDTKKGWLHSVTIFGKTFKGDHLAILENPSGHPIGSIKVIFWNDDSEERIPDEVSAKEIIYEPPKLKNIKGKQKWTAIQRETIYCSEIMKEKNTAATIWPIYNQGVKIPIKRISEFVKPPESLTLHGIWETEKDNAKMEQVDAITYRKGI